MAQTTRSPKTPPEFSLLREVITNDVLPITNRKLGAIMQGWRWAHIQVVPSGGDNPVVEVLFWSPGASAYISEATALTVAAKGANVSWGLTVEALGREMMVAVTSGAGTGKTDIYFAGIGRLEG